MLKNLPIIKAFSSLKITVTCLGLLFILVFGGTIDQVENGLYHAQEQFFHSFFFLAFGWMPFPGAQLVLWVLFVNLFCVALTRFVYQWPRIGILIIHFGLLAYFVSAFVTLHCVEESQLTLKEGETSNVSTAYHDWELSIWKQDGEKKIVTAYDAKNFKPGRIFDFNDYGIQVIIENYYANTQKNLSFPNALIGNPQQVHLGTGPDKAMIGPPTTNGSPRHEGTKTFGGDKLIPLELNKEPEKNIPSGEFLVKIKNQKELPFQLFGGDEIATPLQIGQETYQCLLRRKRTPLPLTVKLIDFMKEVHPSTNIARSYKSKVEIESNGLNRETIIFMNNPLRYKNYTFYQASYSVDARGREYSTLAVVKNSGRLLPYIASLTTFAGLVVHFLMMAFGSKKKVRVKEEYV